MIACRLIVAKTVVTSLTAAGMVLIGGMRGASAEVSGSVPVAEAPEPARRPFWNPPQGAQAATAWQSPQFSPASQIHQPAVFRQPEGPRQAEALHQPAFLLQPDEAQAAPPDGDDSWAGPVPLARLVQYAVANNPQIQAARSEARAMAHRVPQAASLPDPQLMVTSFLVAMETADGPQNVAMRLGQEFPWFGKRGLRGDVAWQAAMAAYAEAAAIELQVTEEVRLAYDELTYVQSAAGELRRLREPLESVVEIARTRHRAALEGAGLEDVLQAETELSKLKTDLVELEKARRAAQAKLSAALHLPSFAPIEAAGRPERSRPTYDLETLVAMIDACQPELEARRREISRDQSSIALARRDYWPDVDVGFRWMQMGPEGLSPVARGRDSFALDVGINVPIYRKKRDAAVREAQCQTAASSRRFAAQRDQLRAEVQSLHAEFREHDRILTILEEEIVPRAEQTFELTTEAYRAGRQDFQQLIDVYRTLLRYRVDRHRREALREQALASLERTVGCAVTGGRWSAELPEPPARGT